jgi:hypothetical protein
VQKLKEMCKIKRKIFKRKKSEFIDENCWDEARVITNTEMEVPEGLKSPVLINAEKYFSETIEKDSIQYYRRITTS